MWTIYILPPCGRIFPAFPNFQIIILDLIILKVVDPIRKHLQYQSNVILTIMLRRFSLWNLEVSEIQN